MASVILKGMKTVSVVGEPWSSPDGKVTIWNVKLEDPSGEQAMYSTMSKAIGQVGFSGDLELYTNAKGKDYIRQAPKEEVAEAVSPSSWHESPEKQNSINRAVALNNAVATGGPLAETTAVLLIADKYYAWLSGATEESPIVDPFDRDIAVSHGEGDDDKG